MGSIIKISGPVVIAEGMSDAKMYDVVKVGNPKLTGEIIGFEGDKATIQVYEETAGIGPGEPVESTNMQLSVELGPGIMGQIYDGIQRPLEVLNAMSGCFMARGIDAPSIDKKKKWDFVPLAKKGDSVSQGQIIGTVKETELIEHRIMVPPGISGKLLLISEGKHTVEETIAVIETSSGKKEISMLQRWPVRKGRPYKERLAPNAPLVTGQRIIDTFFPIAKGGVAAIPGGFGTGKTITQHQLAKWADAQVVVYVGCGERGNEMTEVLEEFPHLKDPRSGRPLMERTVLIANTSNMPFAAREASIYTGITIAEYYRDMGYSVALMGDSTSRWAEALREISARLEEMPGEEGYPAYLPSRIAAFYERAGRVISLSGIEGSLSAIGAVSPPGGDLSEPVSQGTLKVVKAFWALDTALAYRRHFPAINWLTSYSLYLDAVSGYWKKFGEDWRELRAKAMALLQKESELQEIVRLVGVESLSINDRILLETARSLREDFLYQNAYHEVDTYASERKQYGMLKIILDLHEARMKMAFEGQPAKDILMMKVTADIAKMRLVPEKEMESKFLAIEKEIRERKSSPGGM
ncbi:MAG: V-type ATP synthase subunit A [Candidatus Thermoplasmatota archaeon]|nr:V-type ATP synthase subunit A [Candidatus Thermoplasmatota archaeon]